MKREYAAVCCLLQRSGVTSTDELQKAITSRSFHSSSKCYQEPPKNNNGQKRPDNNDEDKDKISTLLAKALLWMLTGYMIIALISLMFPTSNQPEVETWYIIFLILQSLIQYLIFRLFDMYLGMSSYIKC